MIITKNTSNIPSNSVIILHFGNLQTTETEMNQNTMIVNMKI